MQLLLYGKEVSTLEQNQPDMVLMKDGKMMVVRHGEMKALDMMMTLENGTRVAMDGTLTMRDGSTRRLTDGEALTLDGEPTTAVDMHMKDKMDK